MEHRHHRQHHVARGDVERIGQRRRIGMQNGGSMRIQDSLGISSCARGVAKRRCGALVELWPLVIARLGADQVLVTQQIGYARLRHVRLVGHEDPAPDGFAGGRKFLDQRYKSQIEQHVAVFGVIGDVGNLLREQARVDGVHHCSHTRDAVERLQMPVTVPCHSADAVAHLHAEFGERTGQLSGPAIHVSIGIAVNPAFYQTGHDFRVTVIAVRMLDQRRNQQRDIHHQTLHFGLPGLS
jgi:hypothetical protein